MCIYYIFYLICQDYNLSLKINIDIKISQVFSISVKGYILDSLHLTSAS